MFVKAALLFSLLGSGVMFMACPKKSEPQNKSKPCLVDPVVVSPNMYRVISETKAMREIRLVAQPGDRDAPHGHYKGQWTVIRGGKGALYENGKRREVTLKKGAGGEQSRKLSHAFENIGETVIEVKMVETKCDDIAWCRF